jgi:predicted NUDIX family NTP pyrophosphohydrolase
MSNRWPAGIIRKTPVTPAGPFQCGAASGVWSLADASYWTKQGLWPIA